MRVGTLSRAPVRPCAAEDPTHVRKLFCTRAVNGRGKAVLHRPREVGQRRLAPAALSVAGDGLSVTGDGLSLGLWGLSVVLGAAPARVRW